MRLRLLFSTLSLGLAALLAAGAAQAISETYYLSLSNDSEGWLPNGTQDYLSVTIEDPGTGNISFAVELLDPLLDIADGDSLGIARFLFNSTTDLSAANIIGEPGKWATAFDMNGDGFGTFDAELSAGTRQNPILSFSITGIDGDSIDDYALTSSGGAGESFFAVHVAGFVDQNTNGEEAGCEDMNPPNGDWTSQCNILTSAWFGGTSTTPVPEPSTALLLLGGLSGLVVWGRRRLH